MKVSKMPTPLDAAYDPGTHGEEGLSATCFSRFRATEAAPLLNCIAICSVGELFGGVERHILSILSGLRAHGITTLLLLFHDGELATQARAQGIEPVILPNRNRPLLATCRELAHLLERRRVRVVHVHGYKATVYCALALRSYSLAMVKTEHGLPELMAGSPARTLRNHFYYWLDSIAARMAGATVCYVTEDLQRHYRRAHSGLQVMVIPNGVASMDKRQFPRPPELRENWFNVAIVGRLDTVKGHHVAIEALATPSAPPNAHVQIIGVGPSESALRALAQQRGVADRIHFLGFRRNVYDYIAYCDVLLMPSLHEGLPYTLLEAMALGTPIIASRVGGLVEVLQDGITGLLPPPGDPTSIARAIVKLQRDPEYRRRLGDDAQHLQRAIYSVDAMVSRYEAIYRGVSSPA